MLWFDLLDRVRLEALVFVPVERPFELRPLVELLPDRPPLEFFFWLDPLEERVVRALVWAIARPPYGFRSPFSSGDLPTALPPLGCPDTAAMGQRPA